MDPLTLKHKMKVLEVCLKTLKVTWFFRIFIRIYCNSSNQAELLALRKGSQPAITMGIKSLDIDSDSQVLVTLMLSHNISNNLVTIVSERRCLLKKLDHFRIIHVFRKTNAMTNYPARNGSAHHGASTIFTILFFYYLLLSIMI